MSAAVSVRASQSTSSNAGQRLLRLLGGIYVGLLYFKVVVLYAGDIDERFIEFSNIVTLAAAGLVAVVTRRYLGVVRTLPFLLAIVAVVAGSTLVAGAELGPVVSVAYAVGGGWLAFVVFQSIASEEGGAEWFMTVLAVCAALNALIGVWGAVTGESLFALDPETARAGTFGFDARTGRSGGITGENYVGMYDLPVIVAGIALARVRKSRALGIGGILLGTIAVAVSLSRTSTIAAVIATVLAARAVARQRKRALLLIGGALGAAAALTTTLVALQTGRVSTQARRELDERWSIDGVFGHYGRADQWSEYMGIISDAPFLGHGPGYLAERVSGGAFLPHNSFLDVLVEYGAAGLVVYLLPFVVLLRRRRGDDEDATRLLLHAAFWGMASSLLTLSNPVVRILWVTYGAACGRERLRERRERLEVEQAARGAASEVLA